MEEFLTRHSGVSADILRLLSLFGQPIFWRRPGTAHAYNEEASVSLSRPSKKLIAQTIPVNRLESSLRATMWALFQTYYDNVTRDHFDCDLEEKSHVLLFFDSGSRELKGFSTVKRYPHTTAGQRVMVIYSGDTIIDRDYWGQPALASEFIKFTILSKLRYCFTPMYWFLISKGYKTYLLLSRNYVEYWPRYDQPTPSWHNQLMHELASARFGDDWKPKLGIVRFETCHGKLKTDVAPIEPALLSQPDIRFFVERNPGHIHGDELCCLGRIGFGLWWKTLVRQVRKHLF